MHVVNTDTLYHQNKSPEKCLLMEEKYKNRSYLEDCLWQSHHFYPFIVSMDSLLGIETEAMLKCIATRLAMN